MGVERRSSSVSPIRKMDWWRRPAKPAWKQKTYTNCHIIRNISSKTL